MAAIQLLEGFFPAWGCDDIADLLKKDGKRLSYAWLVIYNKYRWLKVGNKNAFLSDILRGLLIRNIIPCRSYMHEI